MSISSTRKISSASVSVSRADSRTWSADNHSQFVENIDTGNNVMVREDTQDNNNGSRRSPAKINLPADFTAAEPDISTSIDALALSGILENETADPDNTGKIGVYTNNQSIIRDEEVERTGRNYLKHFYEKNEHLIDVDELV